MSALHYSARYGFKEITSLLLNHGVDINIRDKNGFNASYWASANKHSEVLALIPIPQKFITVDD